MSQSKWFDARIVRFSLGLLDEDDEARFVELRANDAACKQAWDAHLGGHDAPAQDSAECHLAPAMIARWPDARMRLTGLERESVAAHLARCSACRKDLVAFGFEPELDVDLRVTDLPSAAGVAAGPAATVCPDRGEAPERGRHRTRRGAGSGSRPSDRRRWTFAWGALTGAGIAAAAAALLVTVRPAAPGAGDGVLPWVAPARLRGGPSAEIQIAPGTERLALIFGIPRGIDPKTPATVVVNGPGDARLLETTIAPERLDVGTLIIVLTVPGGVSAGTYDVTVTQHASDVEELSSFAVSHRVVG